MMKKRLLAIILCIALAAGCLLPASAASTDPADYKVPTASVRQGAKGNDAYWLQAMLYQLGYKITVDGSFGPATLKTVKEFQQNSGLSVDGSVGPATRTKLISVYEKKDSGSSTPTAKPTATATPAPVTPAPSGEFKYNPDLLKTPTTSVRKGTKGNDALWVQQILYNLNYDIDVDGSFGGGTATMVKIFQMSNGLGIDGNVGPATRAKMIEKWSARKAQGKSAYPVICIDAGHQKTPPSGNELISPWGSGTKLKNTWGTTGAATGIAEYVTNMQIALKVRDTLVAAGYKVVMTRENNDSHLSNQQRAAISNNAGADITISIHCDSAAASAHGIDTFTRGSGDGTGSYKNRSNRDYTLSQKLLTAVCNATGATKRSAVKSDNYTGINWQAKTCIILECGFASNAAEDRNLNNAAYQQKIANGVLNFVKGL